MIVEQAESFAPRKKKEKDIPLCPLPLRRGSSFSSVDPRVACLDFVLLSLSNFPSGSFFFLSFFFSSSSSSFFSLSLNLPDLVYCSLTGIDFGLSSWGKFEIDAVIRLYSEEGKRRRGEDKRYKGSPSLFSPSTRFEPNKITRRRFIA